MTVCSKTLFAAAGAACIALGAPPGARAWDTTPWDPLPFDQPTQLTANARAKIARVEAEGLARAGATPEGKAAADLSASSLATTGQHGCTVNLGNVVLPQGVQGSSDAFTNVQIKGDVITVCR